MTITPGTIALLVLILVVVIFVIVVLAKAIRIVPQATAGIVERLGKYHKTLSPGLNLLVPFIDRLRPLLDMREQVVSFPPQPVITEDNLVVSIDTVVYFQVTDARAATYEIANYLGAVEQLTTTTLRNVVGGLNLEEALTSRDNINGQLRVVLDEATGKWGIRVGRVELKAIEPPVSIQDAMEQQLRAERSRRAAILQAEGTKQSQILEAEGQRQAAILAAEGDAKAQVLRAEGEASAIATVFEAIHTGDPDDKLLSYQYLQMLPKIAEGTANKLWMIPSEFTEALSGIAKGFSGGRSGSGPVAGAGSGGDFLSRISKLANESLANTAAAGSAGTTMPRADATAADIVPESDLDARLAESNRSVDAHLAAADDATAEKVDDAPAPQVDAAQHPNDEASGHRTSDGSGRR
ncbi:MULTISPECIES: SPFH domain-containing protein [unclassified Curtobacterium]|uniref:SPFH domain-containing protein n=1 Tax=unclassified Curtobacterium TaxID=257496 RepID=UPI00105325EB|nr:MULTISPECIES: SPFH domain-containing protein [unclassified Curtobacterium]TCL80931.1 regulator of protease activity HflC (stomatin/prohibitin superfamily) [Curtobacterium sp. PhB128]TCL99056.1 regulator of protease activity HflC (stomatin/prohibitin superfamily) [Curtobacterium sp. PhB138]